MTHKQLFSDARWICPKSDADAALFRATFMNNKAQSAEITICGLGYFILYVNGERVSDDEFAPAYTDYHNRPDMRLSYPLNDIWSHRIHVMKYDITEFLREGENVLGVMVGGGFYHQLLRKGEGDVSYGRIKLCYKIDFEDGTSVLSDRNTLYKKGFFIESNIFHGERHDYSRFDRKWNTLEAQMHGWATPDVVTVPLTEFYIQDCPSDKVVEALKPELVKRFDTYSVYKVERNVTGYPVIRCDGVGERIWYECAEELAPDLNIDNISVGYNHQRQRFFAITDGSKELYHPYFCWHGFQYFSLSNNAEPVEVRVIHTDIKKTSSFECSDETLNWLYKAFINTQEGNTHGCIPSDCPHRERLGYTGDGQLTCDAVMTEFDAEAMYRKWIEDIKDCQDVETGHVQHTAPFAGGGGGPAGWGGAMIIVPYNFYRHYGDIKALEDVYPNMAKFVKYMESRCENGLVVREEKDGWCLGDWCTPERIAIPEPFVNTTLFIIQLKMLVYLCKVLDVDTAEYEKLIKEHTEAVKREYADGDGGFIGGLQGADTFAAECGAGDERTIAKLVGKYTDLQQFDTGIFGTYSLLNVLYQSGNGDLATELLSNKNEVSFETMRKWGASTLWENWNGESSHSHPMFGASTLYLFREILGIKQTETSVRYNEVVIEPVFAKCLDFAKGHITTPHGKIAVEWKRDGEKVEVKINLCDGVKSVFKNNGNTQELVAGENKIRV
ncbi:MAG: family 78 glycoside hydrolase catalytic domain [Clostridia bacterium]|nr:family 78 glycoside hydrolase catalytic domain [Clostridia bacterium]